MDKYWADSTTL